jgi:DNA/RNA endonuclease YhcR with UshA esterase domain
MEGEIRDLQPTRTGGHFTARVDGVRIFIPEPVAGQVPLKEGDLVRITGIVQTYQGEREIVVESPADIRIVYPER